MPAENRISKFYDVFSDGDQLLMYGPLLANEGDEAAKIWYSCRCIATVEYKEPFSPAHSERILRYWETVKGSRQLFHQPEDIAIGDVLIVMCLPIPGGKEPPEVYFVVIRCRRDQLDLEYFDTRESDARERSHELLNS